MAIALDGAAKIVKEQESDVERTMQNQLKEIDQFVAAYNTLEARSAASQMRAKTFGLADDFCKQGKDALDTLSNRLDDVIRQREVATRKRTSLYVKATVATIVPGMLGEVVSVWRAVGLVDSSAVVALVIAVSVGIAGTLSVLAIDRLIAKPPSGLIAILRQAWIVVLCGATLTTFFCIIASVQVRH